MRRRDLVGMAAGAAALWPEIMRAQSHRPMARVGVLWHAGSAEEEDVYLRVLVKAFADLGYVEGRTIALEHRFPAEQAERFRSLADELVAMKPDVIIGVTELATRELRRATKTIPLVVVIAPDPVAAGLADSLAHPGGNVTGLSLMAIDLSGKRLELLKEAVPTLKRVTLMVDPKDPSTRRVIASSGKAAKELGLDLDIAEVNSPAEIESALNRLPASGSQGLIVGPGPLAFNERARIGAFAMKSRFPVEVNVAEMVAPGALLSYGQDFPDYFRRAAGYVDRILRGARPQDLPIEQPSRFKLTLNLKSATAIGLSLPTSLLASADEVLE